MKRLKSVPLAIGAVALAAGTAAAFAAMPEAPLVPDSRRRATHPARPCQSARCRLCVPRPLPLPSCLRRRLTDSARCRRGTDTERMSPPQRRPGDTTPDTNHGADVSAVARDNHGQATAAQHRPANAGKPDGAGKPANAGKPAGAGKPDDRASRRTPASRKTPHSLATSRRARAFGPVSVASTAN